MFISFSHFKLSTRFLETIFFYVNCVKFYVVLSCFFFNFSFQFLINKIFINNLNSEIFHENTMLLNFFVIQKFGSTHNNENIILHGENFMAIFTILSAVIWFSTALWWGFLPHTCLCYYYAYGSMLYTDNRNNSHTMSFYTVLLFALDTTVN